MSYFQDFASGYQMTSGARERKRDRQDRLDQEALRKQFELDRDMERYAQENAGRQAGQEFTAGENDKGRTFTGSEADKNRAYGTSERTATQGFSAEQAAAERTLRKDLQNQQLDQAAKQFATKTDFDYQNMGLMAGFKSREDARQADPASMANQLANERLAKLRRENSEAGAPLGAPGAPAAPAAPAAPKAAPKPITSKAEYDALPIGTRFVWNGRSGVKN